MGLLENIGGWEMIVIILIGLFIFGPDRLPKAISDGLRMLRQLRAMARNATGDLSRELGTDIELEDLHPKTFLRKHLLSEEDEKALRKPLDDIVGELRGVRDSAAEVATSLNSTAREITDNVNGSGGSTTSTAASSASTDAGTTTATQGTPPVQAAAAKRVYDADAT